MESPPPKATPTRKFQPIAIGKCHVQTATDRFGPAAKGAIRDRERLAMGMQHEGQELPFLWPSPSSGDDDNDSDEGKQSGTAGKSIFKLVPSIQSNRNNLTALSQLYNLYFVAYQGCIFVYRLRSGTQHTLPRCPDLLLRPAASDQAQVVGGLFASRNGHTINHIITGQLGHEEIILAAYDDGDVLAYKTRDLANYVQDLKQTTGPAAPAKDPHFPPRQGRKRSIPKQFFHENVGKSAWGLAIHPQSRLIAVTSNRWEATVFAFALRSDDSQQPETHLPDENRDNVEAWVRQRQRTWRIIILMGREADNLPNVCFLNNKEGLAEKICAIDIKGAIWIADIWKPHQPASRIAPYDGQDIISDEFYPAVSRGWGVLAFNDSCFMEVNTVEELIGFPERHCDVRQPRFSPVQPLAKIQRVLEDIPDNPCPPSSTDREAQRRPLEGPNTGFNGEFVTPQEAFLAVFGNGTEESETDDDSDAMGGAAFAAAMLQEPQGPGQDYTPQAVINIMPLQEVLDEFGQIPGPAFAPNMLAQVEQQPISSTADVQHLMLQLQQQQQVSIADTPQLMAQLQQQSWPFEATFQDLSEALGELEEAFGELEDALPHTAPPLTPMQALAQSHATKCPNCQSCRGPGHRSSEPNPMILDRRLEMIYYPHRGEARPAPMTKAARILFIKSSKMGFNMITKRPSSALDRLAPGYRILRAFEKDFEMWKIPGGRPTDAPEIGMSCSDAVDFQRFRDNFSSWSFRATSRLSLLAHVPELSLIVLGSPTGRVLVASLTRMSSSVRDSSGRWEWKRGIRVEWVLPKASEEEAHRQERRALHGMAIGRIPDDGDRNGEQAGRGASLPRRYRLMLHYQNHDIFSYEVTRNEQTGKICMF